MNENKYIDFGLEELAEGDWDSNDCVARFMYNKNIEFVLMFPGSICEDNIQQMTHFMIYKNNYIDDDNITCIGFCRLNMLKPEYITGYNETYKLSNEEIDFIYYGLLKIDDDGISKWEYIVNHFIDYYYDMFELDNPYKNLQIPNYLMLKEDK